MLIGNYSCPVTCALSSIGGLGCLAFVNSLLVITVRLANFSCFDYWGFLFSFVCAYVDVL